MPVMVYNDACWVFEVIPVPRRLPAAEAAGLPPDLVIAGAADGLSAAGTAIANALRAAGTTASAVRFLGIIDDFRAMAEALGRTPPASRFSADMSRHAYYGTSERISRHYQEFAKEL
jgi:betaine-homocysteine S-methyltransferase